MNKSKSLMVMIAVSVMVCLIGIETARAQDTKPTAKCETPNSVRVTVYKYLGLITDRLLNQGEFARAAHVGGALVTVWDETNGCLQILGVDREEAVQVNELMYAFVEPVQAPAAKRLDVSQINKLYDAYEDALNKLDTSGPTHPERVPSGSSRMGVYRALAELIFQSFKNGDTETSATLGRTLERTWDQIEENRKQGLSKSNPKVFREIDVVMDAFIKPVIEYDQKTPDPASVESAYATYLDKLKAAD